MIQLSSGLHRTRGCWTSCQYICVVQYCVIPLLRIYTCGVASELWCEHLYVFVYYFICHVAIFLIHITEIDCWGINSVLFLSYIQQNYSELEVWVRYRNSFYRYWSIAFCHLGPILSIDICLLADLVLSYETS